MFLIKKTFARTLIEALVSHLFQTVSFQLQSCDSVFSFEKITSAKQFTNLMLILKYLTSFRKRFFPPFVNSVSFLFVCLFVCVFVCLFHPFFLCFFVSFLPSFLSFIPYFSFIHQFVLYSFFPFLSPVFFLSPFFYPS